MNSKNEDWSKKKRQKYMQPKKLHHALSISVIVKL